MLRSMRGFVAFGSVFVLACVAPTIAFGQPIVQPGPPIVQPGPPIVQPGPPIVQRTPVAQPGPYVQPVPYAPPPAHPSPVDLRAARARSTLMTGVVLTAVSHGAAWTLAIVLGPSDPVAWWLALPLGGPAIWGALWGCEGDDPHDRDVCRTLLATGGGFWSALQLGGMVTMITGLAEMSKRSGPRLALGPLGVPGARGLAVWGSF